MSEDQNYFEIDPHNLDREWVGFTAVYHDHALRLADAREQHERAKASREVAKEELKKTAAELALAVRKNPAAFGLAKASDNPVAEVVLTLPEYEAARAAVHRAVKREIKAAHAVAILEVAVKTLDKKETALENCVRLLLADYFKAGGPRTPKQSDWRPAEFGRGRPKD